MPTESNDDDSDSKGNHRLSVPDAPIAAPILPPTSSSRGQVDQNKEKLRSTTLGTRNGSDGETHALEASEPPPKLYLSAFNPRNERGQTTMPVSPQVFDPNSSRDAPAGRTIASAILGRQTKLDYGHGETTNEVPNNTNGTQFKESNRPSNTGAFAIAGPQQDPTSENVDSEERHQGNEASADGNDADQPDSNNMIHAEIAPNVEQIVQERLQAIQQEREDAIVVAVATTNDNTSDNNDAENKGSPESQSTSRTKLLVVTSMICFTVLVAGIAGGIVAWWFFFPSTSDNPTPLSIDGSPSPSSTPTTAMPTTVRQEMILPNLADLGENNDGSPSDVVDEEITSQTQVPTDLDSIEKEMEEEGFIQHSLENWHHHNATNASGEDVSAPVVAPVAPPTGDAPVEEESSDEDSNDEEDGNDEADEADEADEDDEDSDSADGDGESDSDSDSDEGDEEEPAENETPTEETEGGDTGKPKGPEGKKDGIENLLDDDETKNALFGTPTLAPSTKMVWNDAAPVFKPELTEGDCSMDSIKSMSSISDIPIEACLQNKVVLGGAGGILFILLCCLCCICRKCCCRSSKTDARGQYRQVANQYSDIEV